MTQNIKSRNEIIAERDMAWKELRDIRAAINADPNESTLDCVQMLIAKHEKLLSECERVLPKVEFTVDRLIYARDQAARIAIQDTAFATERAAAFNAHCAAGHNADFIEPDDKPWGADDPADIDDGLAAINRLIDACERVDGIDQHAAPDLGIAKDEIVKLREFMRLHGEIYPHLEDQQPYIPVYVCVVIDESYALNIVAVLSDYGAAVNWLDADRNNRALLFRALNKMTGEYATNEEPTK